MPDAEDGDLGVVALEWNETDFANSTLILFLLSRYRYLRKCYIKSIDIWRVEKQD
jgi:hypothetical protein